MFKLVTQLTESPTFLLICDHHECGCFASAPVSMSALNPATIPQQELQFLNSAKQGDWFVSMRIQFCPGHHQMLRDKAQNSLVTPSGAPAALDTVNPVNSPAGNGGQGGAAFVAD